MQPLSCRARVWTRFWFISPTMFPMSLCKGTPFQDRSVLAR